MGHPLLQLWTLFFLLVGLVKDGLAQVGVPPLGSDYNDVNKDGSYRFGFQTGDAGAHYQAAVANRNNQVSGRFGSWDSAKRRIVDTEYTAGRRGFRARGPNIARKMDLSQAKIPYNPPVSPNSPNYNPTYDGYHDPNEDPSYSFQFRSPTYSKQEVSDSSGRVNGAYYYYDDIGERHDVTYEAGAKTGFNVNTPFPDSKVFNGLFYKGPAKGGGKPRGKTSIQQRLDGSYNFVSSGPDQRRTEVSDPSRNVRGSYTYLDDKGQQRTVEYIAGPNIGYRIVKKGIGPSFPAPPPFNPPPNFTDLPEVINPTSSPSGGGNRPLSGGGFKPARPGGNDGGNDNYDVSGGTYGVGSGDSSGGSKRPFGGGSQFGGSSGETYGVGSGGSGGGPPGTGGRPPKPFGSSSQFGGGSGESYGAGSGGSGERPSSSGGRPSWSADGSGEERDKDNSAASDDRYSGEQGNSGDGQSEEDKSQPSWSGGDRPPSPKPPGGLNLFTPGSSTRYPTTSPRPTTPTTTPYPDPFTGYHDRPKPGYRPFPYPSNCCGNSPSSTTFRPEAAFPEDQHGSPPRPPRPDDSDDFLIAPPESLPPKDFNSYRPPPDASSKRPTYNFYKPPGDSTFLSSNKNYFSFPHGVAVRAHIQSLDILPFGSRIPSPGIAIDEGISGSG